MSRRHLISRAPLAKALRRSADEIRRWQEAGMSVVTKGRRGFSGARWGKVADVAAARAERD